MIKISNLSKKFGKKRIFSNACLNIRESEKVIALTGRSGAGKSTLLNILFGLDNDYKGTYTFYNKDTKNINEKDWAGIRSNSIQMIFQDYKLIEHLTVYENLYYFSNYKDKNQILNTLNKFHLKDIKNQNINKTSGGQQQRTAIARAVINRPKILLLDEPTSNLDDKNAQNVLRYIRKLSKEGMTIIITTHETRVLKYADKIYVLKNGKISLSQTKKEKPVE